MRWQYETQILDKMDRCVQVMKEATEKILRSSGLTEDESDLRTWEESSRKPIVGTERIFSAIQYGDSWSFTLKRPWCSKLHINGQGLRPFLQGAKGFHNLLKITPPSLFMLSRRSLIVTAYLKSWDTLTEHQLTCVQHPTHMSAHYIHPTTLP
jgi:hypothetical protein